MVKLLYSLGIRAYSLAIHIASIFNSKAKLWVKGRKKWQNNYVQQASQMKNCIWFHCASLGEFEMARPLIEKIKAEKPNKKILISFFSPSGYEIRKNYEKADLVLYLPLDTTKNAKKFIELFQPTLAVFVKYEIWLNYLQQLKNSKIESILISATFYPSQRFFKWYGNIFRNGLRNFKSIYVQNKSSQKQLESIQIKSIVAGDTRYDQVFANSKNKKTLPTLENWVKNHKIIIVGSSWQPEEKLLAVYCNQDLKNVKFIFAPHDISDKHIHQLTDQLKVPFTLYSELKENDSSKVLIINNIGLLSSIYQYGDLAIIGGGFSGKLHNILEAATFNLPILFGPKHDKFQEANEFIKEKAAFVFSNEKELYLHLNKLLTDDHFRLKTGDNSQQIVQRNLGATDIIWNDYFTSF